MRIMDEREQLLSMIDEDTLDKIRNAQDYVIRTRSDNILMSFHWIDETPVLLYAEADGASVWADNHAIYDFITGIDGTGREQLFEFFVALTGNDLKSLGKLEDEVIELEDRLVDDPYPDRENFHEIHTLRREVLRKKRYYERMELLTDELMQIDIYFNFIDKKFDKLFNNIMRTQEYLDQVRQAYEAQIDIQQNDLMKVFTVVTSIFLPLSLIAGWYGMNLIIPEFQWEHGYLFVIILSAAIVLFMLWLFRKNKWI